MVLVPDKLKENGVALGHGLGIVPWGSKQWAELSTRSKPLMEWYMIPMNILNLSGLYFYMKC
jgi:hypothetical protein